MRGVRIDLISSGRGAIKKGSTILLLLIPVGLVAIGLGFGLRFEDPLELLSHTANLLRKVDRSSPWFIGSGFVFLVVAGLICFPVTVSIAVIAISYEPLIAFFLILAGCVTSAIIGHTFGRLIDLDSLPFLRRSTVRSIQAYVKRNGVQSSLLLRFVPIAPFTLVNLTLGSVKTKLPQFILGCVIGLMPGTLLFTWFGVSLRKFIQDPKFGVLGLICAIVVLGWISLPIIQRRIKVSNEF